MSVLVFETSGDGTEDTGGASFVDTASASAVMVLVVEAGGVGTVEVGGVCSAFEAVSRSASLGRSSVISIHTYNTG